MFSTVLGTITDKLDKRFLMYLFFPTMLFSLLLLYLANLKDPGQAILEWNNRPAEVQAVWIIFFIFLVTFLSYLIDSYFIRVIRLYEGYWDWMPGCLAEPRRKQYQLVIRSLNDRLEAIELYREALEAVCQSKVLRCRMDDLSTKSSLQASVIKDIISDRFSPIECRPRELANQFKDKEERLRAAQAKMDGIIPDIAGFKQSLEVIEGEIEICTNALRGDVQKSLDDIEEDLNRVCSQQKSYEDDICPDKASGRELEEEMGTAEGMCNAIYQELYFNYPPQDQSQSAMPTRLGNILKSSEIYPRERYGLDAVFIWPRLYPLLDSGFSESLSDIKGSMDLMILISFLSYVSAILGGTILLYQRSSILSFLLVFWGGLALGRIAYLGAVEAAVSYGNMIRVAFDLYRSKLIPALGFKAPKLLKEERALWNAIDVFLYRNYPGREVREYAAAEDQARGKV